MRKTYYNNGHALMKKKAKLDIERRIEWLVPHTYAAIGLALYEKYKWEPEQIQELFTESQELWQASTREGWDILENAEEIVGANFKRFSDTGNVV